MSDPVPPDTRRPDLARIGHVRNDPARPDLAGMRDRRTTMAAFDALPPVLRGWLAGARLQWSPGSAHRAWRRSLWRSFGSRRGALARMDALEAAALARNPGASRAE